MGRVEDLIKGCEPCTATVDSPVPVSLSLFLHLLSLLRQYQQPRASSLLVDYQCRNLYLVEAMIPGISDPAVWHQFKSVRVDDLVISTYPLKSLILE